MSKLSICHASLLESYLSVKLAICQSYLFVMLATCHSYMSKQLAHLVPVLRKFLVKLPLISVTKRSTQLSVLHWNSIPDQWVVPCCSVQQVWLNQTYFVHRDFQVYPSGFFVDGTPHTLVHYVFKEGPPSKTMAHMGCLSFGSPIGRNQIGTVLRCPVDVHGQNRKRASAFFLLVDFKGKPLPQKKKQGHRWATGIRH